MAEPSRTACGPSIGNIALLFGGSRKGRHRLDDAIRNIRTNDTCTYKPPPGLPQEKWKGSLPNGVVSAASSIFRLAFSEMPKDRKAWVFGSSGNQTHHVNDFWLAEDNNQGISKRHIAIDFDVLLGKIVPRITLLSTNMWLDVAGEGDFVRLSEPGHNCTVSGPLKLTFPDGLSFWLWNPSRDSTEVTTFYKKVNILVEKLKKELPEHLASIEEGPKTNKPDMVVVDDIRYGKNGSGYQRDPDYHCDDIRYGKNGSVYQRDYDYDRETGSSASVFRVLKDGQDAQLVAKELFFNENQSAISLRLAAEKLEYQFEVGKKVMHVSQTIYPVHSSSRSHRYCMATDTPSLLPF